MKLPRLIWLLFFAQFALFWQYAKREVVWAYPANFDQSAFLTTDYTLYRQILQKGLYPALAYYVHHSLPTGVMMPLQDSLLHFFCGPGRMSNLVLNFGYFVLLEIVLFTTARWLTGRTAFGWLACGLLMAQQTTFLFAGGIFDCRIDFIAFCLYGTFVCFVVRAYSSREKRWFAAAIATGLLLESFRFITFTYLIGFNLTLFTSLLILRVCWRGRRREIFVFAQAMRRTVVLGGVLLVCGGGLIALYWQPIHDYYVVGHLTGGEKHVRAAEQGITSLSSHLLFYCKALVQVHLRWVYLVAWFAVAGLAASLWFGNRQPAASSLHRHLHRSDLLVQVLIILASLFAPWFILTLDESKSPVVANVFIVPATLLLFIMIAGINGSAVQPARVPNTNDFLQSKWWRIAAGVIVLVGSINWLNMLGRQGNFSRRKASVEQIGALYDFLGDTTVSMGLPSPRIAADVIYDWVAPVTINAALYERRGQWLDSRAILGGTIFAVSREQVFSSLEQSDVALVTTFPKEGTYPFYNSIRPLAGEITAWCDAHMLRARVFEIDGHKVTAYLRQNVPLEGVSGNWITTDGIRATLANPLLVRVRSEGRHWLILDGIEDTSKLPSMPLAQVRTIDSDGILTNGTCPAEYLRPQPGHYRIRVDLSALPSALPAGGEVVIEIKLVGSYFVPKDLGINSDTRQLVVTAPTAIFFE